MKRTWLAKHAHKRMAGVGVASRSQRREGVGTPRAPAGISNL